MLGKRLIKTSAGAACTTDTVQILDGVPFQSIATYELDGDATNLVETGYINKAGVFNGSSSRINLPSNPINGLSSVSFSFWIKPNDIASYQYVLSFINSVDGWNGVGIRITNTGKIQVVRANSGAVTTTENSTTTLSLNVWQHVAVSVQQSGTVIYINGSPDGTFSNTPFTTNNTGSFDIGMNEYASGVTQAFTNASIDQVRIFNRVITANEVTTLYGETSASSTKSTTDIFADSSALALYEFEGNANDTGGTYNGTATDVLYNEYDGTASNVTYSTGKFGQAGVFNGSNADIDLPSNIDSTTMSISFWIYIDSIVTGNEVVIELENGYGVWFLASAGGKLGMQSSNANSAHTLSNSQLSAGSWHHVAAVWNSGSRTFYIDNTVQSGGSVTDYLTCNENTIGSRRSGEFFDGKIDQVRIYDKAISAADVTTLYNETVATASTNITLEVPSLVAYYKMSDATDETGSYDGTPTNVNFNVAGKFGNAGEFNGTSSKINTGYIQTGQVYSASFWGKGFSAGGSILRDTPAAGGANTFMDIATGANGQPVLAGNAALDPLNTPSADWTHYVFVLDGTNATIFINGSQATTRTYTAKTGNNGTPVHIMSNGAYPAGFASGSIDQVRIFDRAITSDEVTTLYEEVYCQPTIVPTDHFEPVIYTGSGSSQSISTLDFQPDFTWIKDRSIVVDHALFDSVRGATKVIRSNRTNVEGTHSDSLTSFNNNGFSLGSDGVWWVNKSADNYVAWNWKAGGTAVSNTDGTITSQVSANVDAGFSIVSYTGNQTSSTIGHGLSQAPEMIIAKSRTVAQNWAVYHKDAGSNYWLQLNGTIAKIDEPVWNDTTPTDSVFSMNANVIINKSGSTNIAYCFHSVDGMSRIGSYVGTGASGNAIVTGFRPAFLMVKRSNSTGNWSIVDNKRNSTNERNKFLFANESVAEGNLSAYDTIDFTSNGFILQDAGALSGNTNINLNGSTYIFMAFAEENVEPKPVLANSFNAVTYTGNGSTQAINTVGFQPDLVWVKSRGASGSHIATDSVRGDGKEIYPDLTNAEGTVNRIALNSNGFTVTGANYPNQNAATFVAWCWKASNESTINQEGSITSIVSANPASGFSVVSYTGNSASSATIGHGLSSAPELIITKARNFSAGWPTMVKTSSASIYGLRLNESGANDAANGSGFYNNTAPTASVYSVGGSDETNDGYNYVSYCFHSIDNYQKVGSYSGGTSGYEVTLDFTPGFVMIKNTTSASGWVIVDSQRGSNELYPNLSNAEDTTTTNIILGTNKFTLNTTGSWYNASNNNYIYLAIKAN